MSGAGRRVLAAAVAGAAVLAVGGLSRAPYTSERATHAVLRLAWRARGERVEQCRRLPPEELERLPPHMRQEEQCEGRVLPYRLQVMLDGAPTADELVRAAGARHDRPLYVFRELALEPGAHALAIRFFRAEEIPRGARAESQGAPSRLALDTTITLRPRHVVLVTYDEESRRLVVRDAISP